MYFPEGSMKKFTDREIERLLEQLTFAIALDTTHLHAFNESEHQQLRETLQANKRALQKLRQERERRIMAGTYNPR